MLKYIARRILITIPVVIGVTIITFSIMHLAPGDPARIMLGVLASDEAVAELRSALDLDRPIPVQYISWLTRVVRGDFGHSIQTRRPVLQTIWSRLPATLELTFAAMILSLLIAIPAGIISATRQNSAFDYGSMAGALFGVSMANFWLGLMLMLVFGLHLGWLPISGRGGLSHLILPAITLGTGMAALIARLVRSSMLEVIRLDYIRTARAKGLMERSVIYKHALRNALIPVTTVVALRLPMLFSGAVVTETIFAWPGMGRLLVTAIFERDFPVVQGTVLILALIVILANLLADIAYAYIDPRIKYE
ncbi:ABC transporter permease [Dehalococcoidia bacterium]|nr:ABC transporter permease [Dehalococcoidia bacterium]